MLGALAFVSCRRQGIKPQSCDDSPPPLEDLRGRWFGRGSTVCVHALASGNCHLENSNMFKLPSGELVCGTSACSSMAHLWVIGRGRCGTAFDGAKTIHECIFLKGFHMSQISFHLFKLMDHAGSLKCRHRILELALIRLIIYYWARFGELNSLLLTRSDLG